MNEHSEKNNKKGANPEDENPFDPARVEKEDVSKYRSDDSSQKDSRQKQVEQSQKKSSYSHHPHSKKDSRHDYSGPSGNKRPEANTHYGRESNNRNAQSYYRQNTGGTKRGYSSASPRFDDSKKPTPSNVPPPGPVPEPQGTSASSKKTVDGGISPGGQADGGETGKNRKKGGALSGIFHHIFIVFLAFFVAGLFFMFFMNNIYFPHYQMKGVEYETPNVVNMPLDAARQIARDAGLNIVVAEENYHATLPAGMIYHQYPDPGTNIKPRANLRVVVSKGERPLIMPEVIGQSERDAIRMIEDAGLSVSERMWVDNNEYNRGVVAEQFPPPGKEVEDETEIAIHISSGR